MAGNDVFLYSVPSDANPNDVRLRDPTTSGSGSSNGTGTGVFASVTLSTLVAAASGSGQAAGIIRSVTLAKPLGGASGSALASGSFDTLVLGVVTAAASGSALASGLFDSVQLTPPGGSATGTAGATDGNAAGVLSSVTLSLVTALATGTGVAPPVVHRGGGVRRRRKPEKPTAEEIFDKILRAPYKAPERALALPGAAPAYVPFARTSVEQALYRRLGSALVERSLIAPLSMPPLPVLVQDESEDFPDEVLLLAFL